MLSKISIPGCSAIIFNSSSLLYSHMCGVVEGRYFGTVNGFTGSNRANNITINDNYVDGILV